MASDWDRTSGHDPERSLDLSDMKELMIGGGERDRAEGHVEHVTVQLEVGRFPQMVGREIGEQAFGVFTHAGQRPAQFGQRGVALGVREGDAADPRDGQLGCNFTA